MYTPINGQQLDGLLQSALVGARGIAKKGGDAFRALGPEAQQMLLTGAAGGAAATVGRVRSQKCPRLLRRISRSRPGSRRHRRLQRRFDRHCAPQEAPPLELAPSPAAAPPGGPAWLLPVAGGAGLLVLILALSLGKKR